MPNLLEKLLNLGRSERNQGTRTIRECYTITGN